jgi:hypothetical protein
VIIKKNKVDPIRGYPIISLSPPSPAGGSQELCSTSSRLLIIFEILQEHEVVVHILRSSMIICLDCESVKEHKQEALAFN